ncbi:hypothetical protein NQ315_009154 [Exocentrus adspersus]|uniref:Uncharacterized protein n=1 Tax=Exocentrus adspersus TaxID=1586481 RepID=A0AAV8WFK0_9CUCU|nr:hypothetical protein NQ315_009154 [Exocentrus adspersus]
MFTKVEVYMWTAILFCCFYYVEANVPIQQRSFFAELFGARPKCAGCPPRFCDDDPAIIYGYCCGCAGFFDKPLPVQCSPFLQCPANNYELCDRYNYMMFCCCHK